MKSLRQQMELENWIKERHRSTNHMYDKYLPYEFHLRMTVSVYFKFKHLISDPDLDILYACWGHDLIEDTRTTYNDCVEVLGRTTADIIYAVTNEKGKNRAERANDKYYDGIIEQPGALFVKLCDRIANVKYSAMTNSKMLDVYKKEHDDFHNKLWNDGYPEMFRHLKLIIDNRD